MNSFMAQKSKSDSKTCNINFITVQTSPFLGQVYPADLKYCLKICLNHPLRTQKINICLQYGTMNLD